MSATRILALAIFAASLAGAAGGAQLEGAKVDVAKPFAYKAPKQGKDPKPLGDVSGLACQAAPDGKGARSCFFVSDELENGQFGVVDGNVITPGKVQPLIQEGKGEVRGPTPKPPTDAADAAKRRLPCAAPDAFDELDGEGVALSDGYYYVVGSHGCSRKHNTWLLSEHILVRVPVAVDGKLDKVEATYRLSDVLRNSPEPAVRAAYDNSLMDQDGVAYDGLNIEGVAVDGDTLYAGLRAPIDQGDAFLVVANVPDLFARGSGAGAAPQKPIRIGGLGPRGIRDLARLGAGQLLVLAGPPQEQPTTYALFIVDLKDPAHPKPLGELKDVIGSDGKRAKAEGVIVLDAEKDTLTLLITFDGVDQGGPLRYEVKR